MKLYLIRHGESTWNADDRLQGQLDAPLSERGRQQASRLAERLRPTPLAAIYTSSLRRAWQTAEYLAAGRGLPLVFREDLREERLGIFQGLTGAEMRAQYPDEWARWQAEVWRYTIPGAETQPEFQQRVCRAMADILARHPAEDAAVVTHGGVISIYLMSLLEMDIWHWSPFRQGNTALNVLEHQDGRPRIVCLNDRCHLERMDE